LFLVNIKQADLLALNTIENFIGDKSDDLG